MRIAIIGSTNFDGLEFHINDELLFQGYQSRIFDYEEFFGKRIDLGLSIFLSSYSEYKNSLLLKKVLAYRPDLVICVYRNISPTVIKNFRDRKIKTIHINPDALTTFQNQQVFAVTYDAYFSKDQYTVRFMRDKLKLNVFHYNEAFNPRFHTLNGSDYSSLEKETDIDVLCFGNLYPYRNRMLRLLKEKGFGLTLYGRKAKYFDSFLLENFQNSAIHGEKKKLILNGSKIVFNNFHYAEIESVNNKFFEINGSGAFQICDYKPILNNLLPIDPKRVSFNSIDEAEKLIRYYLKMDKERWEIRDEIKDHFLKNYTYKNMIDHIFLCL